MSDHKNRSFPERVGFAWAGLVHCWRQENSFRFQLATAVLVVVLLLVLRPPLIWSALLILISSMILCVELFNSALECLADELGSEANEGIKAAKDMAAAAVLVLAVAGVLMGLFVLFVVFERTD